MKRCLIVLSVLTVIGLVAVIGCGQKETIAAKVGKTTITVSEIEKMVSRYVSISKKLDSAFSEPKGLLLENLRRQFLDGLVDRYLILEQAEALKLAVAEDELNAKIQLLRQKNTILEEHSFNQYLAEQGMTQEEFKKNIRELMIMEKYRDKIFAELSVSDSEASAYYNTHAAEYAREAVSAAHILFYAPEKDMPEYKLLSLENRVRAAHPALAGEALAAEVKKEEARIAGRAAEAADKAGKGEDFAKLAAQYSEDMTAKQGGSLGTIVRGEMLPEFDQALFALKKGEVAGPLRTAYGFQIIKALSNPKRELTPFEDVKESIRRTLSAEKIKLKLQSLRHGKDIRILWDFKTPLVS